MFSGWVRIVAEIAHCPRARDDELGGDWAEWLAGDAFSQGAKLSFWLLRWLVLAQCRPKEDEKYLGVTKGVRVPAGVSLPG